ncbi:hypothetical protein B0H10DRAFT_2323014, partial [Mycena sp. CBHHK59/15]
MPNPVRKIAQGRPVFSVRIIPWSDDVSGNVSKQYNPHVNITWRMQICRIGRYHKNTSFDFALLLRMHRRGTNLKPCPKTLALTNTIMCMTANWNRIFCFVFLHMSFLPITHNRRNQPQTQG